MRSISFHTLGCKVNAYESEAMKEKLLAAGYRLLPFDQKADICVINTCSVTNIADRKSRQMLHRARQLNPHAVIIAAGCYAQADADRLLKDRSADIVLGNNEKKEIVSVLAEWFRTENPGQIREVGNISDVREYNDTAAESMPDYTRAFLKIQDGCNAFCSYCIIPYVRGRSRSRKSEEIIKEAGEFASRGYREIVLTGIQLSSYGKDFSSSEKVRSIPELMRELDRIPGIDRIRMGSLEPEVISEDFVESLGGIPSFCPHFHLSLQSGSDGVLKRMNRHYTTEEYRKWVEIIRNRFPDAAVTTDVITGFPGETEEEFRETVDFLREIRFYETHIFPYSERKGTRAASFPDQISRKIKEERAAVLADMNRKQSYAFRKDILGREKEILTEKEITAGGKRYMTGNTREYVRVAVPFEPGMENRLVRGEITSFLTDETVLLGKIVSVS